MLDWLQTILGKSDKLRLGIDLGSSAIKLVEISNIENNRFKLETYGLARFDLESLNKNRPVNNEKDSAQKSDSAEHKSKTSRFNQKSILETLSVEEISRVVSELLAQSGAKSRIARFSLPLYASFFTIMEMPAMPDNEIAAAVPYEAKKYIPVPLEDVVLDWNIIRSIAKESSQILASKNNIDPKKKENKENVQIILFAILKEVIDKYLQVASLSDLKIHSLEPEVYSLARAFGREGGDATLLLDVGFSSVNILLINKGVVRVVHNAKKAVDGSGMLNKPALVEEIKKSLASYEAGTRMFEGTGASNLMKKHSLIKCFVSGGGVDIDLVNYLKNELGAEILIGSPFSSMLYPRVLDDRIKNIAPSFAVAAGLAMKE